MTAYTKKELYEMCREQSQTIYEQQETISKLTHSVNELRARNQRLLFMQHEDLLARIEDMFKTYSKPDIVLNEDGLIKAVLYHSDRRKD